MEQKINYRLPIFGDQKITFRSESARLFNWLEKNNEIRRLMNIDQLGMLKRRFSCAHHSKYEYAIMLIYLIEIVQQDPEFKYRYALSRPVEEKGRKRTVSSVSELLKCWALLLPTGHLHGTFAHEKAFLKLINTDDRIKQQFISKFRGLDIQKNILNILGTDDCYRLYQALAVLKYINYKNAKQDITRSDMVQINRFLKYLAYYIDPNKDILNRAKRLFSELRKIAYILLDSFYCNLLFSFSSNRITEDTIKASLKNTNNAYLASLWDSLDTYLIQELYKNTECLFIENLAYRAFFTRLKRDKKDVNFLVEQLINPDSSYLEGTFSSYLKGHKINLNRDCEYQEILHLTVGGLRHFDIEGKLDKIRKIIIKKEKDAYLNFVVDKNLKKPLNDIHLYLKKEKKIRQSPLLINPLAVLLVRFCIISELSANKSIPSYLKRFIANNMPSPLPYSATINSGNWNKIVLLIVKLMLKSNYDLIPAPIEKHVRLSACLIKKNDAGRILKEKKIKNKELQDLLVLAKNILTSNKKGSSKGRVIIYPFNIKIKSQKTRVELGDIDSVLLHFIPKNKIDMYLLQSKGKMQSFQAAKKQATKIKKMLIRRLGPASQSRIVRLIENRSCKTAILKVNLN